MERTNFAQVDGWKGPLGGGGSSCGCGFYALRDGQLEACRVGSVNRVIAFVDREGDGLAGARPPHLRGIDLRTGRGRHIASRVVCGLVRSLDCCKVRCEAEGNCRESVGKERGGVEEERKCKVWDRNRV